MAGANINTNKITICTYVWAKAGREKLKLKYEASTWQVRLMPNGTLHTKQKTLNTISNGSNKFSQHYVFSLSLGYCGRKRCNFAPTQSGKGD